MAVIGADRVRRRMLFVVLVDLSASLGESTVLSETIEYRNLGEVIIEELNGLLSELFRRTQSVKRGEVGCDVTVIGYSGEQLTAIVGDSNERTISVSELGEITENDEWLSLNPISPLDPLCDYDEIANVAQKCEQEDEGEKLISAQGYLVDFQGCRAMLKAFNAAADIADNWLVKQRINEQRSVWVINITGGVPEDCSVEQLERVAQSIKSIDNGNALIMNILSSKATKSQRSCSYPTDEELDLNPLLLLQHLGALSSLVEGRRAVGLNVSAVDMLSQLRMDGEKFANRKLKRKR